MSPCERSHLDSSYRRYLGVTATVERAMATSKATKTKTKRTKKEKLDASQKNEKKEGGACFYGEVAESIGCDGITRDIVQKVCEALRRAIILNVRKHGQYKLMNIGHFRMKHVPGKPARKHKFYDRNKKGVSEKMLEATPPCRTVTGRALAPLKRIFRESCEGACEDAPTPSEK